MGTFVWRQRSWQYTFGWIKPTIRELPDEHRLPSTRPRSWIQGYEIRRHGPKGHPRPPFPPLPRQSGQEILRALPHPWVHLAAATTKSRQRQPARLTFFVAIKNRPFVVRLEFF